MKIYSIVETKIYNSEKTTPRVSVSYSCTDKNLCYKMLKKKAVAYLRGNEKLEDFKQKILIIFPIEKRISAFLFVSKKAMLHLTRITMTKCPISFRGYMIE